MLTLPVPVRIFVHTAPTDMRKDHDGPCATVTDFMNEDPLYGVCLSGMDGAAQVRIMMRQ